MSSLLVSSKSVIYVKISIFRALTCHIFLPTTYVVRGKVMFSLVFGCSWDAGVPCLGGSVLWRMSCSGSVQGDILLYSTLM